MALAIRALIRPAVLIFAVVGVCSFYHEVFFIFYSFTQRKLYSFLRPTYPSEKILQDLSMTESQCRAAFPSLTKEIDDAVLRGSFELERQKDRYTGLVQGRIGDGKASFIIKYGCCGFHYSLLANSFSIAIYHLRR